MVTWHGSKQVYIQNRLELVDKTIVLFCNLSYIRRRITLMFLLRKAGSIRRKIHKISNCEPAQLDEEGGKFMKFLKASTQGGNFMKS